MDDKIGSLSRTGVDDSESGLTNPLFAAVEMVGAEVSPGFVSAERALPLHEHPVHVLHV